MGHPVHHRRVRVRAFPADWQATLRQNGLATMVELDAGTGEFLTRTQLASITCRVTCLRATSAIPP